MRSPFPSRLAVVVSILTQAAYAGDGSFSVDYAAAGACPDRGQFISQVRMRTAKAVIQQDGAARQVIVRIGEANGSFDGELTIRQRTGQEEQRRVPGSTCEEVVRAMALITALSIDPLALTDPIEDIPAPAPSPPPVSEVEPERPTVEPPRPLVRATPAEPWRLGVVVGAETMLGAAPNPLWGGALGLQLSKGRSPGPPWVRLDAGWSKAAAESTTFGEASFDLFRVRLSSCPAAFEFGKGWAAGPWFWLEAGWLNAQGSGVAHPSDASIVWGAGGVGGRVELDLSPSWFAAAQVSPTFPFVRDSFYFESAPAFHQVKAVGLVGGLDVGLVLP